MTKITVKLDRMMCRMREVHVNDAVHKAFAVKKGLWIGRSKRV